VNDKGHRWKGNYGGDRSIIQFEREEATPNVSGYLISHYMLSRSLFANFGLNLHSGLSQSRNRFATRARCLKLRKFRLNTQILTK
jgi:hypothetical protein